MTFTSDIYVAFLGVLFIIYWGIGHRTSQNVLLLVASYTFYGWIHPWFCLLIATSTVVDYACGLGIERSTDYRKRWLQLSLLVNLGMLGVFKYFNFFATNFIQTASSMGFDLHPLTTQIMLPVGISFYTFQTLSYTIDIYNGRLKARRRFLEFAVFVSFFPQLVAGPIERARRFLPQLEQRRKWDWGKFNSAWPLFISGYLKKMVIADNVSVFADKVFLLERPSLLLLGAGTLAFALQIYADFSAYTDIARGSARLFGLELQENFRSPYLAISPSDFWRRWHISFSTWIRDYVYIPLGGSRVSTRIQFAAVVLTSMGLSGLWHGAAWHFLAWGIYHGLLVFIYHAVGLGGRWQPASKLGSFVAWLVMFILTIFGWTLFRTSDLGWLTSTLRYGTLGASGDSLTVSLVIVGLSTMYALPLFALLALDRLGPKSQFTRPTFYGLAIAAIVVFFRDTQQDFIYFQF